VAGRQPRAVDEAAEDVDNLAADGIAGQAGRALGWTSRVSRCHLFVDGVYSSTSASGKWVAVPPPAAMT
jgi:hypothetical protein